MVLLTDDNKITLIIAFNSIYLVTIYIIVAKIFGNLIDDLFIKLYGFDNTKKSDITLLIEISVQFAITASVCYGLRRLIDLIPFPFQNYKGYQKIKLNEIHIEGGLIWSAFVLLFQTKFRNKLMILKNNMTIF
jgi:hypothetical protein